MISKSYSPKSCCLPVKVFRNDRGTALIISILLLAIMTILGTTLMSTSTTEIQLSGNYRSKQESFYAADRTIEYAMQSASGGSTVVDLYLDQNNDVLPLQIHRTFIATGQTNSGLENPDSDSDGTRNAPNDTPISEDDSNSVNFIGLGSPPVGSGSDASVFAARNYAIHAVGISPLNTTNPSRTSLRSQFAKIVPK